MSGVAFPEIEVRQIDEEFNDAGIEVEFEDTHFHASDTLDEDYKLILEQKRQKHKHWLSDYALRRIYANQNYILLIVGQVGCQPKGSKILMANHLWKNIEDIKVGDILLSPQFDGSNVNSKVLQTHKDYSNTTFNIVKEGTKEILYSCSHHHKIPFINEDTGLINHKKAEELSGKKLITFDSNINEVHVRILPRHSEIVYGFQLDSPNKWYVTDNNMVTHNSGKSFSAISLAEDIDPYFNVDRIVFHPQEFIALLDMGLPKGSVILWEEVGVSLSSRDWYREQNKIISSLFETFRRHNLILIMTVPNVKFIDSRIRSMIHGFAEMIDPTFTGGNFGWLKYFHVIVEQRSGKIRHRYPRIRDDEGRVQIMQGNTNESGNMHFNLPSKEILPAYEEKKLAFVKWQQKTGLESFQPKKIAETFGIEDYIQIMSKNPRKFRLILDEDGKNESMANLISNAWVLFNIDHPDIKLNKKAMTDSLRFVLTSYGYQFKSASRGIQDGEIHTVIKLLNMTDDKRVQVASMMNTTDKTLRSTIKRWQKEGIWDEAMEEYEANNIEEEEDTGYEVVVN